jgi:4-carboxymuconolactone decarboxylase
MPEVPDVFEVRLDQPARAIRSGQMATDTQQRSERQRDKNAAIATRGDQTNDEQRDRLRDISQSDDTAIANLVTIRVREAVDDSDLDAKTFALVNIAALAATGGDEASYLLHVTAALDAGASVDEIIATLTAVGPNVGVFRMVAAADPLATALGVNLAAGEGNGRSDGGE